MVSDFGVLAGLGGSSNLTYSLCIDSSRTMTSAFHSFFGGLDSTPGKAFIDLTAAPLRQLAKGAAALERHGRKIRADRPSSRQQPSYAVTQPPPLTPLLTPRHEQKVPAAPVLTEEQTYQQRLQNSMGIVGRDYPRIHTTIESLWGQPECSTYIQNLILSGGDGMGNSRVGFKLGTVAALMLLDELHDTQFGKKAVEHIPRKPRR